MNTERFARIDLDRSRFEKKECNHCLVYSEFCGVQSVMLGVSVGVTVKDLANVILSVKTLMCLTSTLTCVKVCIHRVSKKTVPTYFLLLVCQIPVNSQEHIQ